MEPRYCLHYAPDNASLIIRLALEEIGVPYDCTLVDRRIDGQRAPDYLALNPNGLIPVLETPQGPMFETGAILLWLVERHNALGPAPNDTERSVFLKWLVWLSNTMHADMRLLFYPEKYVGANRAFQSGLQEQVRHRLRTHLGILEEVADHRLFSHEAPTVLGLYAACLMRWMALYPKAADRSWFRLQDTPRLAAMLAGLETRASVHAAQAAEGLGPTPFTAPRHATPPEGSAT